MSGRHDDLRLDHAPRVEDVRPRRGVKLFDLMVVALLERDAPMTMDELVARLTDAGVEAPTGDLALSLKRSWHGREPVHKRPDDRFVLNYESPYMLAVLYRTGLRETPTRKAEASAAPAPADDVPITEEEYRALFHHGHCLSAVSDFRQLAAIVDIRGRPVSEDDLVHDPLYLLTGSGRRKPLPLTRIKPGKVITHDEDGRLCLDAASPDLAKMRACVRKAVRPTLEYRRLQKQYSESRDEIDEERSRKRQWHEQEAKRLRRAIIRVHPWNQPPRAASLLDVGERTLKTFVGPQVAELAAALAGFDLLAGVGIRDALHHLGLALDRWRLVELSPPRKSIQLNRRGRKLRTTLESFITSTTSISKPIGEAGRLDAYLAEGQTGKLTRRLESDVKTLYAFYRYGVLHQWVRLRWGFLDEIYRVEWALPGDPSLQDMLRRARADESEMEIVIGSAPGWKDPWSRARRCTVLAVPLGGDVVLRIDGERTLLSAREIQAIRVVGGDGQERSAGR